MSVHLPAMYRAASTRFRRRTSEQRAHSFQGRLLLEASLSLRIQCHTVQSEDEESLQLLTKSAVEKGPTRSDSPEPMTADEEKLADSAAGTTLIGSQPVSRFSTTRGGSTWKRGTTKPVEDEESAPVSAPNTAKLPK